MASSSVNQGIGASNEDAEGSTPQHLDEWFKEYLALDITFGSNNRANAKAFFRNLDLDAIDTQHVERRIELLSPQIKVLDGFCTQCRTMLGRWPDGRASLWWTVDSVSVSQVPDGTWKCRVGTSPYIWPERKTIIVRPACHTCHLEAAMRLGCRFCNFLLQRLKDCGKLDRIRKLEARVDKLPGKLECALSLQEGRAGVQAVWLDLPGKPGEGFGASTTFWTYFRSAIVEKQVYQHQVGDDQLDIARAWLKTCTETHVSCRRLNNHTLPTRLVAVKEQPLRLIHTAALQGEQRYATLSHCWGTSTFTKLQRGNIVEFLQKLPFEDLGQTFKDAITITKRLGIEFLWIDCLCIVQDDESDWEQEAATMYTVYKNSYLNIAASTAKDGCYGILTRENNFRDTIEVQMPGHTQPFTRRFEPFNLYKEHFTKTILATRAWALQEKLLPLRTLHIGDRGSFWECRECVTAESLSGDTDAQPWALVCRDKSIADHENWQDIVRMYSATNLTFAKDKLPALSGIARAHHAITQDQYLAGMWRSKLQKQLCWRPRVELRTKPAWRAPSWSWMSLDGPVTPQMDPLHPPTALRPYSENYTEVLEAVTSPTGPDPFGQIADGLLKLSCYYLLAGQVNVSSVPGSKTADVTVAYNGTSENFSFWPDYLGWWEDVKDATVYLLPVVGGWAAETVADDLSGEELEVQGLVGLMLRSIENGQGPFVRFGSFGYKDTPRLAKSVYRSVLQLMETYGAAEAAAACSSRIIAGDNGKEQYVIEIL